eukprot:514495_1
MSTPQVNNSDLNQALTPQINPDNKTFPPQQSNGGGFSEKCGAVCNDICKDKCNNICKDKCNDICKDKCKDICKDAMKISLIISIISLIFTIIAAICIGTVLSDRISDLETNPDESVTKKPVIFDSCKSQDFQCNPKKICMGFW